MTSIRCREVPDSNGCSLYVYIDHSKSPFLLFPTPDVLKSLTASSDVSAVLVSTFLPAISNTNYTGSIIVLEPPPVLYNNTTKNAYSLGSNETLRLPKFGINVTSSPYGGFLLQSRVTNVSVLATETLDYNNISDTAAVAINVWISTIRVVVPVADSNTRLAQAAIHRIVHTLQASTGSVAIHVTSAAAFKVILHWLKATWTRLRLSFPIRATFEQGILPVLEEQSTSTSNNMVIFQTNNSDGVWKSDWIKEILKNPESLVVVDNDQENTFAASLVNGSASSSSVQAGVHYWPCAGDQTDARSVLGFIKHTGACHTVLTRANDNSSASSVVTRVASIEADFGKVHVPSLKDDDFCLEITKDIPVCVSREAFDNVRDNSSSLLEGVLVSGPEQPIYVVSPSQCAQYINRSEHRVVVTRPSVLAYSSKVQLPTLLSHLQQNFPLELVATDESAVITVKSVRLSECPKLGVLFATWDYTETSLAKRIISFAESVLRNLDKTQPATKKRAIW